MNLLLLGPLQLPPSTNMCIKCIPLPKLSTVTKVQEFVQKNYHSIVGQTSKIASVTMFYF